MTILSYKQREKISDIKCLYQNERAEIIKELTNNLNYKIDSLIISTNYLMER